MFACDAKFAKASVSSWELWKNVISVMSLCESAWKLCVLEDEFNMQISNSSYLYPCQGPYCPSLVSPPLQPVPWALAVGNTEYEGCAAIKQPKGAPGKALVCVGSSHRSCSLQSLVLALENPQSHPEELQSRRAWGLWVAVSLFRMASCRCAASLFWAVTVWVILWERFFKGVLKIIINCPFGNTSISYLPMDLLTNSVIRAFWKLAEPHLLREWKEKISLLSTQQLKNSHEWQLWGQQQ